MPTTTILTEERKACPACGQLGVVLYENLKDRLLDTAGTWTIKKCADQDCGTIWLYPIPKEEAIPLLYTSYPTHGNPAPYKHIPNSILKSISDAILYNAYGYGKKPSLIDNLLQSVAYIHPAWRDIVQARVFYLPFKKAEYCWMWVAAAVRPW